MLATDSDSGVNGQISYFIVDGNHNNAFVIDSVRGILATSAVLDREIVSSYKYDTPSWLLLHLILDGNGL